MSSGNHGDNQGGTQRSVAATAGLGGRYAAALFDMAGESRTIDSVERSLAMVRDALAGSDDLRRLIASPVVDRGDAIRAVVTVADTLQLDATTRSFLGVLAENRRLSQLPGVIRAFRAMAARHRGEISAEVMSAHPLDDEQVTELKHQLRLRVGREVSVDLSVDPQLLGGLVVRVGSQMIDSSIRTRLNALAHAMKG